MMAQETPREAPEAGATPPESLDAEIPNQHAAASPPDRLPWRRYAIGLGAIFAMLAAAYIVYLLAGML